MTMETSTHAGDLVEKGKEALQHHHLTDAERLFLAALQCLPQDRKNASHEAYEAYHGLAKTFTKKGRYCRNDEKEWHRYYLQSLCMYQQAIRLASSEEQESKVKEELTPVQEIYCQCLETRLFPPPPPTRSHLRRSEPKPPPKMNSQWLQQLKEHIQTKLESATSMQQNGGSRESVSSSDGSSVRGVPARPTQLIEEHNKRRVDFNRVRKAIMRMVKMISSDMRSRYIRKRISQDTLKRAVSSEMLSMLTPENENMDVVSLFESYIVEEEPEFEIEAMETETKAKLSSTESESEDNVTVTEDSRHVITPLCSIRESYVVPRTYHHINSSRQNNGTASDIRLNGILRIWRAHERTNPQPPLNFVPHKLNFEECSPVTETAKYSFQDIQEVESFNAVSEQKLETTLAALLSNIGDKFSASNHFVPADELYTYALGIYQHYDTSIPTHDGKVVAHLLNSMGKLRCRKGDMIGGTHLMEKSVEMYRTFHGEEEHVDIITVWYELGRAFFFEQCDEDTLLDSVMKTVKSRVDRTKNGANEGDEAVDYVSESDDSDDESEDCYLLNIHEAKCCFNHALRMLHNLRRKKHEMHNAVYVEVLSKLADCCLMLGDFQKATLCYEEALVLFQNIVGSSLFSLNAHVLTMLGVTNFLLGNYPKAVNMLETAHILQQHMNESEVTIQKAFTLTMLGVTNHTAGQYYKCVAWCLKAHEMYEILFPDLTKQTALQCWFIVQNVYMLGYAYSFLKLREQALYYLELSHDMAHSSPHDDGDVDVSHTAQVVHILKLIADVYVALDRPQRALEHYERAHEHSVKLGEGQRSNTLHNQLLNCMAGLHITSKNYNTAAECLEQALDYQENLQDSIKGDMFGMLHSLGLTYTFSGDIDKAISCYRDAIETYHEDLHGGSPGPEIAGILGRLATLYHVKMCLEEDEGHEMNLCQLAEQYYRETCELDPCSPVVVQFANFQYQQSQTPDALLTMLSFLLPTTVPSSPEVVYNGPEQAVLPSHLQFDVDEVDEVVLNAKVFGHFLAILCYKELNMLQDAEDSLCKLYKLVYQTSVSLNFSILGYALMEMDLLEEAAEAFSIAFTQEPESTNSLVNVWICLVTAVYRVLSRALYFLLEQIYFPVASAQASQVSQLSGRSQDGSARLQFESVNVISYQSAKPPIQDVKIELVDSKSEESRLDRNTETPQRHEHFTQKTQKVEQYLAEKTDQCSTQTTDQYLTYKTTQYSTRQANQYSTQKTDQYLPQVTDQYSTEKTDQYSTQETDQYLTQESDQYLTRQTDQYSTEKTDQYSTQETNQYLTQKSDQYLTRQTDQYLSQRINYSSHIGYETQHVKGNENESKLEGEFVEQSHNPLAAVAMDISPDGGTADPWQEEVGPNADALDEMLKSSEEIEAELQECLRHIDAVQGQQVTTSTDWATAPRSSSESKTDRYSSHEWRNGRYSIESSKERTDEVSNDWQSGRDSNDSNGWRNNTDSKPSHETGAAKPVLTGWRAATSSRTQEILMSIQNNNFASRQKAEEVEKLQDVEPDEEQWQVWEEEEVIETPPEILAAILKAQQHAA